ncbi:EVE domain-containing protein [Macrococcus epidermidis]|uniref:EVE domain-containing protein n=1 Tax=Macrococcus epidermidis TaxID=1902580 RepID=UPI0020B650B7|nr:EVE domain-containing protein [Macrococcus epidermidis]UTH16002.1 EVE domain-containing protein [Macrococcus epidermidis]
MNYFWLNCGYNRFNHFEDLMGQVSVFDSTVHFNPNEGYTAFKRALPGDKVIFYQVQNKIGILGAGSVLKVEEPRRGQIKIHFKYEEKLAPFTKEYLIRDEALKLTINGMKEQLLNPLTEADYEKIMRVGRNEEKINRYFIMKEDIDFEADETYTIYVRNINGVNRNGFKHYGQMQPGDKVIIYKITPERGIYGTAIVVEGMQRNQPIPGRTDSTAVKMKYIEDITPRTIYELDREPQLRAQYFLNEKWNESVTEITRVQYDTCLNPSTDLEPIQSPTIQQMIDTANYSSRRSTMEKQMKVQTDNSSNQQSDNQDDERLNAQQSSNRLSTQHQSLQQSLTSHKPKVAPKPWKMIYVFSLSEHFNGVDTAIKYLQLKRDNLKIYTADTIWTSGNLYGQYVKEDEDIVFHQGIITEALASPLKHDLLIEDFHHLNATQLKPLIHAAQGEQVSLPVMKELTRATIGLDDEATYQLDVDFKIVAITTSSIDDFKAQYPIYMHQYMKFYAYK